MKDATRESAEAWIAELERLEGVRANGSGLTAGEIASKLNKSVNWVREKLQRLLQTQRLAVGRRSVPTIAGTRTSVPVYTIKRK